MTDFGTIRFSCLRFEQFSKSFGDVSRALPLDMRERLRNILLRYFATYGINGAYERMNNRTVAQIFAEYQPADLKPIVSGEVDGIRYALYEGPPPPTVDDE